MKKRLSLLSLVTLSACGWLLPGNAAAILAIPSVPFVTVGQGQSGFGGGLADSAVIRSNEELDRFWQKHAIAPGSSTRDVSVDFSQRVMIAVVLDSQPTGMIRVDIASIEEKPDELVVHAIKWVPDAGQPMTTDIGVPYHLVTIARTEKPVVFAPLFIGGLSQRDSSAR